ncbi:ICMT-domain-containing protein, partial [Gloeophyllum trabeum ATCC 11539]
EMAVIVASRTSYSPLSDAVLRVLAPAGPPYTSSINLTKSYVTGSVLAVLGGALRYWCYRTLGRMFTFRLSIVRDHRLITTGPYGIVRHPSYTGILLAIPGIQLCMLGPGSWLRESGMLGKVWGKVFLVYWGVLCAAAYPSVVARVPKEDEMMRNRFGVEWEQWAKQVAYRIIPGMY